MVDLSTLLKQKNQSFNVTPQHLGTVLRDNNNTRKRTRHRHFPLFRYKKPISLSKELKTFYTKINQYSLDKIISLDETSIQPAMFQSYSRCQLGNRCYYQTNNNFIKEIMHLLNFRLKHMTNRFPNLHGRNLIIGQVVFICGNQS